MTYEDILDWMFKQLPMFENKGGAAYKPGLENTKRLMDYLGNLEKELKYIHIAGTNGKGSTSSLIASALMESGCKTGLFTSPHLTDFRERITIDGNKIPKQFVVDFINEHKTFLTEGGYTFFEMNTALAFYYFAKQKVDFAVIEVGIGGRLDSTNIITPQISVITNIEADHCALLGYSRAEIAKEKAGIVKPSVPLVLGQWDSEISPVFEQQASLCDAPLYFADGDKKYICGLKGNYQRHNTRTAAKVLELLGIDESIICRGFENVVKNTGLRGRWQTLNNSPLTVCDTGHNPAGINEVVKQIYEQDFEKLHIVFGVVADKDISSVLKLLPQTAEYYFCNAAIERALNAQKLKEQSSEFGLKGTAYSSCEEALKAAESKANKNDMIFIGGSIFVVGEILME